MAGETLPYCDDLSYINGGSKGDCIPRQREGNANIPESINGQVTEKNSQPIK